MTKQWGCDGCQKADRQQWYLDILVCRGCRDACSLPTALLRGLTCNIIERVDGVAQLKSFTSNFGA